MWVPPETKDPILLHHPTRRSVGYFGAVRLRDGKFWFRRETDRFNAATFFEFIRGLRRLGDSQALPDGRAEPAETRPASRISCSSAPQGGLDVYAIDVEGGSRALSFRPQGQSMLVDTGYDRVRNCDADRILAAKAAGTRQIDYLVITHYHHDHVGGVPQLATQAIARPLPGGGQPNPACGSYQPLQPDTGENAHSIGIVVTNGAFRLADLGDLYWNQEHDLACPNNKLGVVDVSLTTHHGKKTSGSPRNGIGTHPEVAIMNNGPATGGSMQAWQTIHDSAGLLATRREILRQRRRAVCRQLDCGYRSRRRSVHGAEQPQPLPEDLRGA